MESKFNKEDLGKKVILELDTEEDPIAKALGASKVTVSGTIIELDETFIKVKTQPVKSPYWLLAPGKVREIDYIHIKSYKFCEE